MGHGDELVLADANFPAASVAAADATNGNAELIYCTALTVPELLEAICQLMPLDQDTEFPATVMQVPPQDAGKVDTPVWDAYVKIINDAEHHQRDAPVQLAKIERFAFYERAKKAYCVVATGESDLYSNLILTKGIVLVEPAVAGLTSSRQLYNRKKDGTSAGRYVF